MDYILFVIVGPPAVGKTTVAHLLSKRISENHGSTVLHFEVDDLRHAVVQSEFDDGEQPLWLTLLESLLSNVPSNISHVIVDGLFYEASTLDRVLMFGSTSLVVKLTGGLDLCMKRNLLRHEGECRLPDEELISLHGTKHQSNISAIEVDDLTPELLVKKLLSILEK